MPPSKRTAKGRLELPPGVGKAGEAAAEAHLRSLGYKVVARNYRTREGELDIVALAGNTYVIAEVKTRRSATGTYGVPEESLTKRKQARLIAAAQAYLAEHGLDGKDWRIDLVLVQLDRAGRVRSIDVVADASGW